MQLTEPARALFLTTPEFAKYSMSKRSIRTIAKHLKLDVYNRPASSELQLKVPVNQPHTTPQGEFTIVSLNMLVDTHTGETSSLQVIGYANKASTNTEAMAEHIKQSIQTGQYNSTISSALESAGFSSAAAGDIRYKSNSVAFNHLTTPSLSVSFRLVAPGLSKELRDTVDILEL